MNKRKKIVAACFIATIFFLTGCETDSRVTYLNLRPIVDDGLIEMMEWNESDMWIGQSLGVAALGFEMGPTDHFYGVIELSDVNDTLVAQTENLSTHDLYLMVKVFLNYEEVPFRVNGEETYTTEFVFFLERGYQVDIPFVINADFLAANTTSKLTVGIFADPHRELINEENHVAVFWGRSGMVLNNDLIIGNDSAIQFEPVEFSDIMYRQEDRQFVDLWVASDFSLNAYGFISHPELHLQVERGKEIELLFYASPFASQGYELENYLIFGMLNWQQISLNAQPFLWVDTFEHGFSHVSDHGRFTLPAIDEVGYHEFMAILVSNPEKRNSITHSFPLFTSNRLIIEVVE
ncbi:MAG: hypothetical protein FWG67_09655 [Defluviitaleaceae bacterium]|nr:hypothetical protein [Defluviitaleaceae bacterium]